MKSNAWFEIRAEADEEAEVWIYDEMGAEGPFSETVSAKEMIDKLKSLKAQRIALHINSPGGSVFDGQAIYNALRRHPATVTSYIDGVAASIAGVVALAGDSVVMADNALFMIHDPHGLVVGTAGDMVKMADLLNKVADTIAGVYVAKTGKPLDEIRATMAEETWYTAAEAKAAGFVDKVGEAVDLAACAHFDLTPYRHVPPALHLSDAATPFVDLPINSDHARAFDAGAARQRLEKWASSDGSGDKDKIDWPKYRKGFFWYDAANAQDFGAYKLVFADVVGGEPQAIVRGIHAAAAVMQGARGGVDIPDADRPGVKAHIKRYYTKLGETVPWEQTSKAAAESMPGESSGEGGMPVSPTDVGRTLSQASYDKIAAARDHLNDVLATAEPATDSSAAADVQAHSSDAGAAGDRPDAGSGDTQSKMESQVTRLVRLLAKREHGAPKEETSC